MPSIFRRTRRMSESIITDNTNTTTNPQIPQKTMTMDRPAMEEEMRKAGWSAARIKAFFKSNGFEGKFSLRRRKSMEVSPPASSPEDIINTTSPINPTTPINITTSLNPTTSDGPTILGSTPTPLNGTLSPPVRNGTGTTARNINHTPRSSITQNIFPSPKRYPENFSLGRTTSPEGNDHARRASWTPSYPIRVPSDGYADVAPDGHTVPNGKMAVSPIVPGTTDENALRRSQAPSEGFKGDLGNDMILAPPLTTTPHKSPEDTLPTPPTSANPPIREDLKDVNSIKPSLNIQTPLSTIQNEHRSSIVATNITNSPISSNVTPSTSTPSSPQTSKGDKRRPDIPIRRTTLISSPPMPQPIKNLPTLANLSGYSSPNIPGPSWGSLAKEGGPKTPGWGGLMSPALRNEAGTSSNGFPFGGGVSGIMHGTNKGQDKGRMSEGELRKAKRAMPVMLREPSFRPDGDEGGDVGADEDQDDDDDESETEMELQGGQDDDSEAETETEPAVVKDAPSNSANTLIAARRKAPSPRLGEIPKPAPSISTWSLPTPKQRPAHAPFGSWTQFAAETPGTSLQTPRPNPASRGTSDYSSAPSSEGYFDSQPNSSSVSVTSPTTQRNLSFASVSTSGQNESSPVKLAAPLVQPDSTPVAVQTNEVPIAQPQSPPQPGVVGLGLGPVSVSTPDGPQIIVRTASHSVPQSPSTSERDRPVAEDGSSSGLETTPPSVPQRTPPMPDQEGDSEEDESENDTNDGSEETSTMSHDPPDSTTQPSSPMSSGKRPCLYTQVSRSMIDVRPGGSEMPMGSMPLTVMGTPRLETIRSREAPGKIDIPRNPSFPNVEQHQVSSPGSEWAKPPPTPAAGLTTPFWGKREKDMPSIPGLKRRRSADDLVLAPPKYEPPFPGTFVPRPRDEEGMEKLPGYWCASVNGVYGAALIELQVHIEGLLQRKMEFSSPGVQSRDRSWKKLYFILRGTALQVYKFDPHRFPLKSETVPVPVVTDMESEEYLHVHLPGERRPSTSLTLPSSSSPRRASMSTSTSSDQRRTPSSTDTSIRRGSFGHTSGSSLTIPDNSTSRRASMSASNSPLNPNFNTAEINGDGKDTNLFNSSNSSGRRQSNGSQTASSASYASHGSYGSTSGGTSLASHFQHNALIKTYTLQNAESGLAADYVKRKNVVRVRAEGQQFLLQTDNARDVVDWIEAFQAATNVSLDLDQRPMPKIITLPRRRRRRVVGTAGANGTANGVAAANGGTGSIPAPNTETTSERERERMLLEDQLAAAG
ncbi:hypothetical protein M231_07922 [Tremella mesenterica]|uniref:PH domain-containing protein n=1 Tax=Tremella mesenterica TaxID=5217 RepID=A0A4Q1BF99_TREME|nr:hypothetical protein M231_07922 [Tremella mesenterica]